MKTSFIIVPLLLLGAALSSLCNAETTNINASAYFCFPRATLVAESGAGRVTAELSSNFAYPTSQHPEPEFRSGHEFQNGAAVGWELVRRTEHGDVYLVTTKRVGAQQVVTPVLFRGEAQTIISTNDLKVLILPEPPKDK